MNPKQHLLRVAYATTLAASAMCSALGAQQEIQAALMEMGTRAEVAVSAPSQEAAQFLNLTQPRKETYAKVNKVVRTLNWKTSLRRAAKAAVSADKPILWIQAYGKLDGYA